MVDLEPGWMPTTKLNAVAAAVDSLAADPLPDGVTRDDVEEYCYTIRDMYGRYVDELTANTELSRREAQTWALRNLVYDEGERLSYEAIGLYIWAVGRATEGSPLSRTITSEYHERAREKIDRAEATVKRTGPPPYPDDLYDDPTILWVEASTGQRLQQRLGPDENFDDLLRRLLDEALDTIALVDLVETYRRAVDSDYVAVDTVYPEWDRTLRIVVSAPREATTPAAIADAEAVTIDGTPFESKILERESVSGGKRHLPVFDARPNASIPPEEGLDHLRTALDAAAVTVPELVSLVREDGGVALAVDSEPVGTDATLYAVYPDDREVGHPLAFLDRVLLDDRTVSVGAVEAITADGYDAIEPTSKLLWASADDVPTCELPDDPVARRELFPSEILRTE